jgi:hypothetical protein
MKPKFLTPCLLVLAALFSVSCASSTEYGECVGVQEDDRKDPALDYRLSGRNVALAVVFSETLVVPLVVVLAETLCPVGRKAAH